MEPEDQLTGHLLIEARVARDNNTPVVRVTFNAETIVISTPQAREFGMQFLRAAESAEADASLVRLAHTVLGSDSPEEQEASQQLGGQLIAMHTDIRREQERQYPVEHGEDVPPEGWPQGATKGKGAQA